MFIFLFLDFSTASLFAWLLSFYPKNFSSVVFGADDDIWSIFRFLGLGYFTISETLVDSSFYIFFSA